MKSKIAKLVAKRLMKRKAQVDEEEQKKWYIIEVYTDRAGTYYHRETVMASTIQEVIPSKDSIFSRNTPIGNFLIENSGDFGFKIVDETQAYGQFEEGSMGVGRTPAKATSMLVTAEGDSGEEGSWD